MRRTGEDALIFKVGRGSGRWRLGPWSGCQHPTAELSSIDFYLGHQKKINASSPGGRIDFGSLEGLALKAFRFDPWAKPSREPKSMRPPGEDALIFFW